jgi:hypothetical protein
MGTGDEHNHELSSASKPCSVMMRSSGSASFRAGGTVAITNGYPSSLAGL